MIYPSSLLMTISYSKKNEKFLALRAKEMIENLNQIKLNETLINSSQ